MQAIKGVVNWGIIGCGDVCEVKSGPAFNKVSDSKLVAVMRRDEAKAADYAKRHNVPKYYSDASKLINDPEVNAIYIATPPSSHASYMAEALAAGKPVYVEKPVTINSATCKQMIDAKNKLDGFVTVAHYRRGLPLFRKVKQLILDGTIGTPRLARITTVQSKSSKIITQTPDNWRVQPEISGGGLFHDLSPHQLDIIYWIFGAPKSVSGNSLNQSKLYSAPDFATIDAVFDNDVVLQGAWTFSAGESATQDLCEIIGSDGVIRFAFFRKPIIEFSNSKETSTVELDQPVNIQHPMIDAITKYFKGQGPNPCSLEEALVVMQMMDQTNR